VYIECSAFEPGVEFQFDAYTYLTPERKTGGSSSGTKVTMRKLPTAKPLTSVSTSTATSTASTTDAVEVRDLYFGLTGDDVVKLQQILISTATGSSSEALAKVGATGYFGPLTQAALAEWQAANGVTPALGYFGTITRAKMKTLALAGIWW
jgi:peptidoglycan hydrolase-like protein with peptidoglycan-binding domain